VSSGAKVIAGTVTVAVLAAGGAAFAAVKLTSTSHTVSVATVTAPFGHGVGTYGLGGGRLGGRGFGGGLGPGDDGGAGGGLGFGLRRFLDGGITAVAGYLGLSATQLQADLANGQTLAQIAKTQGKSIDGLVAAMTVQVKKGLDAAVAGGMLTQTQANHLASRLAARMKDMANGVRPQRGFDGGSGGQSGGGTGSFGSNA
jgi:hypothetical protein